MTNAPYWSPATAGNCLEAATDHGLYAERTTDDRLEAGEGFDCNLHAGRTTADHLQAVLGGAWGAGS